MAGAIALVEQVGTGRQLLASNEPSPASDRMPILVRERA